MPCSLRLWAVALLLPTVLSAQASPYIPLDDPRLPALEHLIARGEIPDPSPQIRPFRRADALAVLDSAAAQGTIVDTALTAILREAWSEDTAEAHWEVRGEAGGQGYTDARRDRLHPAGPGGVRPYVELRLQGSYGPLVLVSRPAVEPRLPKDPDWPGRRDLKIAGRHSEAYLSAQWKFARLFYGQMEQNWGPPGFYGLSQSDFGYPRPYLGFEIGTRKLELVAQASTLANQTDNNGIISNRYFFIHRLNARLSRHFDLALWETTVLAGPSQQFDDRYRNPVTLLLLANEYGLGDDGNVLVGFDASWRLGRATLQAQVALDDFQYKRRSGKSTAPNRYAFTLAAAGPLGRRLAWRAGYSQVSSLAFHTSRPGEAFLDQGVGIGRNFVDNDQVTVRVSAPVLGQWVVAPELTLLRQGQGRITDPWPSVSALSSTPALFIGTVERTWRAALDVAGRRGPLTLHANAGFHHVENAGHVPGRTENDFVAQIQATLGLGWGGRF